MLFAIKNEPGGDVMKISNKLLIVFTFLIMINGIIIISVYNLFGYSFLAEHFVELLIIFSALILVNVFVFYFFVRKYISIPLKAVKKQLNNEDIILNGKLNQYAENNEIWAFIKNIKSNDNKKEIMIKDIKKMASVLNNNENQLANSMDKASNELLESTTLNSIITGKMLFQNNSINDSAKNSEEIDALWKSLQTLICSQGNVIENSSSAVIEMITNISNISDTIDTVNSKADNLISISQNGYDIINKSLESIVSISKMSEQLNGIIEVITDIASKIDVLSINASIEAAHAGECGKGFAAVAKEIKLLAEKTTKNAKDIHKNLEESNKSIQYTSEISTEARKNFNEIFTQVSNIVTLFREIKNSMQEQSKGGNVLQNHIVNLNDITDNIQGSSDKMKGTVESLITKMSNLKDIAKETLSTADIMEKGMDAFQKEIDSASNIIEENSEHIVSLQEELINLS